MQKRHILPALSLLAALFLLLSACGQQEESSTDDFFFSSDGNYWSTDGNSWYAVATDGDYSYATNGDYAYATDGDYYIQYTPYATDGNVDASLLTEVHVSSVDELLNAIAPETIVLLAPGEYNLQDVTPALYRYCYFKPTLPAEEGSGQLILCNLYDCVIASESGKAEDVSIIAEPRSATVLTIEDSYGVQLCGLTLGHTEGAICSANVLNLEDSGSVYIDGCDLYGCGTVGINAESCWAVTVADSTIHDCSYNGLFFISCGSMLLDNCTLRNVGRYTGISLTSCQFTTVQDCRFENNDCNMFLQEMNCYNVSFNDCSFQSNRFHCLLDICDSDSPFFWGMEADAEQYTRLYNYNTPSVYAVLDGELWR